MNVLIVFCHPTHDSFTGASLQRVLAGLAPSAHDVRLVDLYAEGFRPELSLDERARHSTDHRADPELRGDIADHIENLRWAEALVLVYPTWWAGQPAMLKGWFDRVLVNGVAWHLPGASEPHPTAAAPTFAAWSSSPATARRSSSTRSKAREASESSAVPLRVLCNVRCRTRWVALYNIDRATLAKRQAFLDRVERRLARL